MSKTAKPKKNKVPRMTEEEYAAYIMSLKDSTPPLGFEETAEEEIEKNEKKP